MKKLLFIPLTLALVLCLFFSLTSCSEIELEDDGRTGETTVTKEIWDKYVNLKGVSSYHVDFESNGVYDMIFHEEETESSSGKADISVGAADGGGNFNSVELFERRTFSQDATELLSILEFENFEYNSDTRSYVYEGEFTADMNSYSSDFFDISEFDCVISVKFEDNVLKRIDIYAENGIFIIFDMYVHESFVFSDFVTY